MSNKNRRRRAAAAVAGATITGALAAPGAVAAPYTITQCGGAPLTPGFVSTFNAALTDRCASNGGAQLTVGNYELSPWGSQWSTAGYRVTVPGSMPNTTITAIDQTLSAASKEGDATLSFGRIATNGAGAQWGDELGIPAGHWDGFSQQRWQRSGGGSRSVETYVSCYGPCQFAAGPTLTLHGATITLDDSAQPDGATFETNGVLSGDNQNGITALRLSASDADSGVRQVTLRTASGTKLATKQFTCSANRPAPCPQSTGQIELPVDTTTLPDGDWRLALDVTDYANNTRVVLLPEITVRNRAPSDALSNALVANNGPGGDSASGQLVPSRKRTKTTVGFRRPVRLSGTLVDAQGKPIANATLDVMEAVAGGARAKVGEITTDAQGKYSYKATLRANTVVDVVHGQAVQSLNVGVRAGVHVKVKRSRIRLGGTAQISGRVLTPGVPRKGVTVDIRVKAGRGIASGGLVHTDKNGRFVWRHRFRHERGTFVLWAHVASSDSLPAKDGSSRRVRVTVR